ncbi:hypothetical protein [Globicatella sp. PHS-GS-PNBC-21-1553]|uniref:hypothetical protein n=1 Tax=Globicatella sp. PHS-GS-PNBC-21-1553 TaxID=2885764 RepID=UPI00298F3530|nr:hypothetical protein [Globicatella sp. PHS-GS-PNBC-21-1553]WPC08433.1 hypothetical protein LB888_10580 [Globicatella sp. PHS-GS-PNBC-21-1553]
MEWYLVLSNNQLCTSSVIIFTFDGCGSGQEVENRMIFTSSVHPRTVGSGPKVENQMIFALSVHPRKVE